MDGLECSEILLSSLGEKSPDHRIDAEYYKKEFLSIDKTLSALPCQPLAGLCDLITDGTHYTPEYQPQGVPFLSAVNVKENFFDLTAGYKYISKAEHQDLVRRCRPKPGDILLRKVGVGPRYACVIPKSAPEHSIFVSLALLRAPKISAYYLSTYINCSYGQKQLLRFNKGISQPDLHLEDIARLSVPLFGDALYESVERTVYRAQQLQIEAIARYGSAEQLLLQQLHLDVLSLSSSNVALKTLSSSFGQSGRLDAEYYQKKYDDLFDALANVKTCPLEELVYLKKSIEPGSDEYLTQGIPFVRVADLSRFGLAEPAIHLSKIPFAHMGLQPQKDTILLSKDGSVGIAYRVEEDLEVVTSGAILHLLLKQEDFLPDYLTLVLNSPIVQMQAERDAGGSVIQHWKPAEIEKTLIPWLPLHQQEQLVARVRESFSLRKQSQSLLAQARKAVELAIEQDEQAALSWLAAPMP